MTDTTKSRRGRPKGSGKSRTSPALMLAVWKKVRHHAWFYRLSIAAACEDIIARHAVKIRDERTDSEAYGRTINDIVEGEKLRKWFYDAEAYRKAHPESALAILCEQWERAHAEPPHRPDI